MVVSALAPSLGWPVPLAAIGIAAEMLVFSGVHLQAGAAQNGPMVYWLAVAAVCVIIAVGRWVISPL